MEKGLNANKIILEINSIQGYIIESRKLVKNQDQVLIITNFYKPGKYICVLKVNGKIIDSVSFIIIQ
jgi:hypothetical protein